MVCSVDAGHTFEQDGWGTSMYPTHPRVKPEQDNACTQKVNGGCNHVMQERRSSRVQVSNDARCTLPQGG